MSSHPENDRYSDDQIKSELAGKLCIPIKKNGLTSMRTDDIAKYMGLSKATLYKYFGSKDEIIEYYVHLFIKYFVELDSVVEESKKDYHSRYLIVFHKMVMLENYGSEIFIKDLRSSFRDLWEEFQVAIMKRNEVLYRFFEKGMADGAFQTANPDLLILQDETCLAKLIDPGFLFRRNMTSRKALFDYYHLRINQIFTSEFRPEENNEAAVKELERLSQKLIAINCDVP